MQPSIKLISSDFVNRQYELKSYLINKHATCYVACLKKNSLSMAIFLQVHQPIADFLT